MSGHARISPSNLSLLIACPGSYGVKKLPNVGSAASEEGTLAHGIAASIVLTGHAPEEAPEDMIEHGRKYTGYLSAIAPLSEWRIEQFTPPGIFGPDCYGTPDAWVVTGDTLHVVDYKYGHSRVLAERNWQLLAYAALINDTEGCNRILLHIVQPRDYSETIRFWEFSVESLERYTQIIRIAIEEAREGKSASYNTGKHCMYCLGRYACSALSDVADVVLDYAGTGVPLELDPQGAGNELGLLDAALQMLTARKSGIEAQIEHLISSGTPVPGYVMARGRGRTDWTVPTEEVVALGEMLGIDLRKSSAVTPLQAIKKGVDEAVIKVYSTNFPGTEKLKRIDPNEAKQAFKPKSKE
jgi:hypothetical protein